MSQDLRLQAGVGVLNLLRRVEVEVEGSLSAAAAAACSALERGENTKQGEYFGSLRQAVLG